MKAKVLVTVAAVALCVAPAATAKFRVTLSLGASSPKAGRPITVVLRSGVDLDHDLKLIAVAPGKSLYDVIGTVTGASGIAEARIPRDGFAVPVVRVAPNRWRAFVTFPRAGRWRLTIPNWASEGFAMPPPLMRTVVVR